MAQYINKDALVAEIDRLRKIQPTDEFQPKEQNKIDWLAGKEFAIMTLQLFLDTLELKEVDFDREVDKWYNNKASKEFEKVFYDDIEKCAKYFFELGLSVIDKARRGE